MLVATDFDGTISAIVPDPAAAALLPGAAEALAALALHPRAAVAVITGRSLADLRARCPIPGAHLVGGHGNERDGVATPAPAWGSLAVEMQRQAVAWPGAQVEIKPWSLTLHYRRAPQFAAAVTAYAEAAARRHGLRLIPGAGIAELAPPTAQTKGDAVLSLRRELGCDVALYLGDQPTDEDVFAVADEDLFGIRVGAGPTQAPLFLPDPQAAVCFLQALPGFLPPP
ncbi:MAG: trehalose-phosphatase [Terriglobales bacterium]